MNGIKAVAGLLFKPVPHCLICGNAVASAGYPFCENCSSAYSKLINKPCRECGKQVWNCGCVEVPPCIKYYRLFEYEGDVAPFIIYRLKQYSEPVDYLLTARRLKQRIRYTSGNVAFDCVCYVPRNKKGINRYGFDHARFLGEALARLFDVPCKKLLAHTGVKGEQKRLSKMYRGFAAKTRFEIYKDA